MPSDFSVPLTRPVCIVALATLMLPAVTGCRATSDDIRHDLLVSVVREETERAAKPENTLVALGDPDPALRRRAVIALGRVGLRTYVPAIEALLRVETDASVIEEALFALGLIGSRAALPALSDRIDQRDPWVRAAAIEALGRIQDDRILVDIIPYLTDPEEKVRMATALALYRLGATRFNIHHTQPEAVYRERTRALARTSHDVSPEVRWRALYALAGIADAEGHAALLDGLSDTDPRCRLFAARGLCRLLPQKKSTDALLERLGDTDYRVVVEVLKGLGHLIGEASLIDERIGTAAARLLAGDDRHASFHVRAAAADLLGIDSAHKDALLPVLVEALHDPSPTVQGEALVSLAHLDADAARPEIERMVAEELFLLRIAAARATAVLPAEEALGRLEHLAADSDVRVATTALEMIPGLKTAEDKVRATLLEALARDDVAIRATAAAGLTSHAHPDDIDALRLAYSRSPGAEGIEARQQILSTLAMIGGPEARRFLEAALADEAYAVRERAVHELERTTGIVHRIAPPSLANGIDIEEVATAEPDRPEPVVALETSRGVIVIRLFASEAPIHVQSFLARMRAGKHDGLSFHRVVSNWVIQGLDPRGDGWGTGGLQLPDEINRRSYVRGTVGMPNAGPDTGGCQLFVTLLPAPRLQPCRLQHGYTVFGQVISGFDVLDRIQVGDLIERVRPASELAGADQPGG